MNQEKNNELLAKIDKKNIFKRYAMLLIGLLIYACAYNLFLVPNNIVAGGISGIAIITKDIIAPPYLIFSVSAILLIISYFLLGKEKTSASVLGSLLFPIFVKLTTGINQIIKIESHDMLLIAIFAGVIVGVAIGLIFKNGFTTGGTDIINQIISKYCKKSIGSSMLIVDGIIVLSGGFIFGWTKVMYAVIIVYILTIIADKVILGISDSKAFYIVTEKDEEVKKFIIENLSHGATVIEAKGGFSGKKQHVLMCVVPTKNYFQLKEGIKLIDYDAFFVITDAYEVEGGE